MRNKIINIGIITYNRTLELKRILKNIIKISKPSNYDINIIVVENDLKKHNLSTIKEIRKISPYKIIYELEKNPGIPSGRNKIIELSKNADFIIFIDDDEIPSKNWIKELIKIQEKTKADVVWGKIISILPKDSPKWIKQKEFFSSRGADKYVNGQRIYEAATNNVLIKKEILKNKIFDNRLQYAGGSDILLFNKLLKDNYKFYWAEKAVVYDLIPISRANKKWILNRAWRAGTTYGLVSLYNKDSIYAKIKLIIKALIQIVYGLVNYPGIIINKELYETESKKHIYKGAGIIAGLFGIKYLEYRR